MGMRAGQRKQKISNGVWRKGSRITYITDF